MLIRPPYTSPPPYIRPQICNPINIPNVSPTPLLNIGPSNLSSLRNIKFTKNATLPQVLPCKNPSRQLTDQCQQ